MSDALRIDLALARAAGLPVRSANDASVPRDSDAISSTDLMFSPLALLLTRFLPPAGTPAPTPTPEEAHLLLAYLQQRVVAVLQAAGVAAPRSMRVSVDVDGGLRLMPAPAESKRVAILLRQDPDVTRLADVLRRPLSLATTSAAVADAHVATPDHAPAPLQPNSALRRVWPWQWFDDASTAHAAGAAKLATPLVEAALGLGVVAELLLAAWLLS